ncbi:interferon gamma receptor 2-like [Pelodytes ibericus]
MSQAEGRAWDRGQGRRSLSYVLGSLSDVLRPLAKELAFYSVYLELWRQDEALGIFPIAATTATGRLHNSLTDFAAVILLLLGLMPLIILDPNQLSLPAPENVNIYSYNLEQQLRWDPVPTPADLPPVTYTVQYKSYWQLDDEYIDLCVNITETHFVFTNKIKLVWKVILRVRAELGHLASSWTQTPAFQATKDTKIGPVKALTLYAYKEEHCTLYVRFESPLPQNAEQKPPWTLEYELSVWKKTSSLKKNQTIAQTSQRLVDLDPWTEYCVQVTAFTYHIEGETSKPVCHFTTGPALTAGGYTALVLSIIIVCSITLGCAFLMYKHRTVVKSWLNEPLQIPLHVEQYLEDHSPSDVVEGYQAQPTRTLYDQVSIVDIELIEGDSGTIADNSSLFEET